jgi:uncharacterized UPF0146 family protein
MSLFQQPKEEIDEETRAMYAIRPLRESAQVVLLNNGNRLQPRQYIPPITTLEK